MAKLDSRIVIDLSSDMKRLLDTKVTACDNSNCANHGLSDEVSNEVKGWYCMLKVISIDGRGKCRNFKEGVNND